MHTVFNTDDVTQKHILALCKSGRIVEYASKLTVKDTMHLVYDLSLNKEQKDAALLVLRAAINRFGKLAIRQQAELTMRGTRYRYAEYTNTFVAFLRDKGKITISTIS